MAVQRQTGAQTDAKNSTVDLRGKEYYFAKELLAGFALAALGERPVGVISEGKNIGLASSVNTGNQLKVLAGAVIAVGDDITPDANAKARVAASTHYVFGRAKSAAQVGELVEFEVTNEGVKA